MDFSEKIKPFGSLNQSVECLERSAKEFENLWNDGQMRLTQEDVKDIESKIRKAKGLLKQIDGVRELFDGISNNKLEEKN